MDEQAFTEALGREGYDEVFTKTALVTQVLGTHSHPFAVKALVTDGQLTLGSKRRVIDRRRRWPTG